MINEVIYKHGIMPIVNTSKSDKAPELAKTMTRAGMNVCEVVFRSKEAAAVLAAMRSACPDMIIGAGTILTETQVDAAMAAGAQFVISPGIDRELCEYCLSKGIQPIPGVSSASEVQLAVRLGLSVVKFFPAKQMGGLATINALAAPFPDVKYIPTNGVGFDNIDEYLGNTHILACGGTFPCPPDAIAAEDWDGIYELCRKALRIAAAVRTEE